jgi:hypothetical protein
MATAADLGTGVVMGWGPLEIARAAPRRLAALHDCMPARRDFAIVAISATTFEMDCTTAVVVEKTPAAQPDGRSRA